METKKNKLEAKIKSLTCMLNEADDKIGEMEVILKQEQKIYLELLNSNNKNIIKINENEELINVLETKLQNSVKTIEQLNNNSVQQDLSCSTFASTLPEVIYECDEELENLKYKLENLQDDNKELKEKLEKLEKENISNISNIKTNTILKDDNIYYQTLIPALENKITKLENINIKLEQDIINLPKQTIIKSLSFKDELDIYDKNNNLKMIQNEINTLIKIRDNLNEEIKTTKNIYILEKDMYTSLLDDNKPILKNSWCCFL